jgi:hypothetical protein
MKMDSMKRAPDGYLIQVGDVIRAEHALGTSNFRVHRVTKNYAFVRFNEIAEGKFPRQYGFGFGRRPREIWQTTNYIVFCQTQNG